MTITQIIGALIVISPFLALAIFISVQDRRWWAGPALIGVVFAVTAFIGAGAYLLTGGN